MLVSCQNTVEEGYGERGQSVHSSKSSRDSFSLECFQVFERARRMSKVDYIVDSAATTGEKIGIKSDRARRLMASSWVSLLVGQFRPYEK